MLIDAQHKGGMQCGLVLSVSDESGQILRRLYLQTSFQTVYAPSASTVQRQRRHPRTGDFVAKCDCDYDCLRQPLSFLHSVGTTSVSSDSAVQEACVVWRAKFCAS